MITLRRAQARPGSPIESVIAKLEDENIPYQFGELKVSNDKKTDVLIAKGRSISFEPYSLAIGTELMKNKIRIQVWDRSETKWGGLSLGRRLLLHG